jgi:hypothetical protein
MINGGAQHAHQGHSGGKLQTFVKARLPNAGSGVPVEAKSGAAMAAGLRVAQQGAGEPGPRQVKRCPFCKSAFTRARHGLLCGTCRHCMVCARHFGFILRSIVPVKGGNRISVYVSARAPGLSL